MSDIDEIRKRLDACPIPPDARADWDGTNHYEITTAASANGYWYLTEIEAWLDSQTEFGRNLGAVLDYACAYKRDVAALLERIAELEATGEKLHQEALESLSRLFTGRKP